MFSELLTGIWTPHKTPHRTPHRNAIGTLQYTKVICIDTQKWLVIDTTDFKDTKKWFCLLTLHRKLRK